MIKITSNLDYSSFERDVKKITGRRVRAGVLNHSTRSAKPDFSKGVRSSSIMHSRYVQTKGRNKNIPLHSLAKILDSKKHFISSAVTMPNNKKALDVIYEILSKPELTETDIRRVKNGAIALVRNPILRKEYGSNAAKWKKRKGFDMWGVSTGTLFKNIKAEYTET